MVSQGLQVHALGLGGLGFRVHLFELLIGSRGVRGLALKLSLARWNSAVT